MDFLPPRVPVVLLHGWPVTPTHWRHLIPILEQEGFATVPITLPGLGEEPSGVHDFRKRALAEWLRGQLTERGLSRVALIGHDWGGTVAAFAAAAMPHAVSALVIEEEVLPGVDLDLPARGRRHYPSWHGPFNRAAGLAEHLVPGREEAYYGTFLRESAGPAGLDPAALRSYVDAYSIDGVLAAGLAYYRSRATDIADVEILRARPIGVPVLGVGGGYAMGSVVADGLREVATDVTGVVLDQSGHYPLEQEPDRAGRAVVAFLRELDG